MNLSRRDDTIAAVATAPGRGAVGIVRVSGPGVRRVLQAVLGRDIPPRQAHYGPFRDVDGSTLDRGIALFFPAPHSYTGEDVLELQAHGGPVVLQLLLARCLATVPGSRPAEPGEFTQRAFLNGKLDLAQAEAVSDLIDASTETAARSASRSLAGELSRDVQAVAANVMALRALVEATLDFPEEDIDFLHQAAARERLAALRGQLEQLMQRTRQGALLREGLRVVLAGQPNVGKSSLLNALAGAELAIVTPIPGTTRDRISSTIQISGMPLHLTDTAGLRDDAVATDEVERLGMARSWSSISEADLVLFLHDLTRRGDAEHEAADEAIARRLPPGATVLSVYNKSDAVTSDSPQVLPSGSLCLSARTGEGLQALRQAILDHAGAAAVPDGLLLARTRHVQALMQTQQHLSAASEHLDHELPALELLAEELRLAHEALGQITGQVHADELLGDIFGRFCIGK